MPNTVTLTAADRTIKLTESHDPKWKVVRVDVCRGGKIVETRALYDTLAMARSWAESHYRAA